MQQLNLETTPDFSDKSLFSKLKKHYLKKFPKDSFQSIIASSTTDGIINKDTANEKIWNKLLQTENIENELEQLPKQRALLVQSELIEKYLINRDKIYLKNAQKSQELPPQVKFGIAQ